MLTPMDIFRNEQLIFANECYLFWVSLSTYKSDWKYVQRKEIYTLAIIDELSLIAIGGKNFSKFAYLGKETARSNIKLYSCNQHEHLFTYDLIGTNVGHVLALHYIATPPNNTKLLLVHTSFNAARHVLYFLRVKAFDKIEMFGHFAVE